MATLVLSTVGNLLGGPVGGAIGALIGQSVDQELFAPRGPRLGELKVQSSDYGTQIPRVYGTMRVAGSVIWATDLEVSAQTSGAKGQSSAVTSYKVSLAVALSSRIAGNIGRIWADGKLLRGAAGDFKVPVTLRFYAGSEAQAVDPLIGSIEGIDSTPAYRGLALAVFENLELAEYGNRIPFLTFELIADAGAVGVANILADASGGAVASGTGELIAGYAAYGASIQAALEPLVDAYSLSLFDAGEQVRECAASGALAVAGDAFGNSAEDGPAPRIERDLAPAREIPTTLRLGYYDPEREFQAGEARASSGEIGGREERHELAAVLGASEAKGLCNQMLGLRWARRDRLTLRLPPAMIGLEPGQALSLPLTPERWIVDEILIESWVAVATLVPEWRPESGVSADPGRVAAAGDIVAGQMTLALAEIGEDGSGQEASGSTLLLAASSASPGWRSRGAAVSVGQREFAVTLPPQKSVLGLCENGLGNGQPWLRDDMNALVVALIDADQWLENATAEALADGANLAMVGLEAIQFASAESLGAGRFRLSGLWRGRLGSDWAMAGHQNEETFFMLDEERLTRIDIPPQMVGALAAGRANNAAGTATSNALAVSGERQKPLRPVKLEAALTSVGELEIRWVRRSRGGLAWIDEAEAPLGQLREAYRVTVTGSGGSAMFETAEPQALLSAAAVAALGSGPATIMVQQVGDRALSRPATLPITLS